MHGNARLNLHGRRLLIARIQQGRPVAHVADEMGVSRQTAYKWWRRWRREGEAGLRGPLEPAASCPHQTPRRVERRIVRLRQRRKLGSGRIAGIVGVPASTVHRVLCRHGLNRLRVDGPADRPSDPPHPHDRPGELVHIDVKKLGRIPRRWWLASSRTRQRRAPADDRGSATPTSTPPSTLTAASPTASPRRRERRHLRRVLGPSRRLVRRPRHHHRDGS